MAYVGIVVSLICRTTIPYPTRIRGGSGDVYPLSSFCFLKESSRSRFVDKTAVNGFGSLAHSRSCSPCERAMLDLLPPSVTEGAGAGAAHLEASRPVERQSEPCSRAADLQRY